MEAFVAGGSAPVWNSRCWQSAVLPHVCPQKAFCSWFSHCKPSLWTLKGPRKCKPSDPLQCVQFHWEVCLQDPRLARRPPARFPTRPVWTPRLKSSSVGSGSASSWYRLLMLTSPGCLCVQGPAESPGPTSVTCVPGGIMDELNFPTQQCSGS